MKRMFFLLFWMLFLVVSVTGALAGDIQKGVIEVDGALDLAYESGSSQSTGNEKVTTDQLNVNFVNIYYFAKNIGAGLHCEYEQSEADQVDDYSGGVVTSKSTTYLIGPSLKMQFSVLDKVNLFVSATAGKSDLTVKNNDYTIDGDGSGWKVAAGASYFLLENLAVNLQLYYLEMNMTMKSSMLGEYDYDYNKSSVNLGLSFYID